MANVLLLHSVLGLRPGVTQAADRLRAAGHVVHVPDLYDQAVFDDYGAADTWLESIGGIPELMARTRKAADEFPDATVFSGFSNGAVGAELLAAARPGARGAILMHGAVPLPVLQVEQWPAAVPVEVHYAADDPFLDHDAVESFVESVRSSGAECEAFEYPGHAHLFTDSSLPHEYDERSAELLFQRVLDFLGRVDLPAALT